MRWISVFVILTVSFICTSCNSQVTTRSAELELETIDSERNKIDLTLTIRYQLNSRQENKLVEEYGRQYGNSLFQPIISSISNDLLTEYSAIEIYNYKREEIELKLGERTKLKLKEYDLEVSEFLIRSVGMSDTLMQQLEKEHNKRYQDAMNNCTKEVTGVISAIQDLGNSNPLIFYEFIVDDKNYKGIPSPGDVELEAAVGDSLIIEFACENPIFNRVKK